MYLANVKTILQYLSSLCESKDLYLNYFPSYLRKTLTIENSSFVKQVYAGILNKGIALSIICMEYLHRFCNLKEHTRDISNINSQWLTVYTEPHKTKSVKNLARDREGLFSFTLNWEAIDINGCQGRQNKFSSAMQSLKDYW